MTMMGLLDDALRAGLSIGEFWELTPWETVRAIKASVWRWEQEHKERAWEAWHTAALQRVKRMPQLGRLTGSFQTRRLKGTEAEKRKRELEEMTEIWHRAQGLN